ncbi:MAG: sulfotransferase family 2 domain-containing protein [Candidatus Aminicenantes bacterium]|nr:sulfotransferase family 2 domain-containing protein [Candidatus Aminicenantes bacterium]
MKAYDPNAPLISLHIPKCAGQSFMRILRMWFKDNFRPHYLQLRGVPPPRHDLEPGICIHGHFNRAKGIGVPDYYPAVSQFITVLRDPLEAAVSNYFYWKTRARERQIKSAKIRQGSEGDYKDIDDFFRKRPRSHVWKFMPCDLTSDNYRNIVKSRFLWIGVVECLQSSVDLLADILGFDKIEIPRINPSIRDEELKPEIKEAFIARNSLEFAIYDHACELLRQQGVYSERGMQKTGGWAV